MAFMKPFRCVRPAVSKAGQIAALPYDVYNRAEARAEVEKNALSFLAIDRSDTAFPDTVGSYEPCVYEEARRLLEARVADGTYIEDEDEAFYLYELTMDGRSQTGIVACASVDEYVNGVIKKHENTREEKEKDRICHINALNAQTGPIFLTYRPVATVKELVEKTKEQKPLYDFVSEDGIGHRVFKVTDAEDARKLRESLEGISSIYIADGHHRAASAVKVGLKRREEQPGAGPGAEFNSFLSVLFPADELAIFPYNRVVKDLNGLSAKELLRELSKDFAVRETGQEPFSPQKKGQFGLYLEKRWYALTIREELVPADPVRGLDVSLLQDRVLGPILGILDPRTDKRIDFVGGIRGLKELERRADSDMKLAFSMYPTSMEELLSVADAGKLMPPKSTWFEPKLRSGLFIHRLA
ncbi:MAG: DUF1015 domain-containing protein [Lachnospiraceae bacterium]|nr:DUF1015 domain-containing protein [Lachnospiraceae bacterium]